LEGVELDYDRQARGHKLTLSLDAGAVEGVFGALITDEGEVRPDLKLSVDLSPSPPSLFRLEVLPQIRFRLKSPEGLLVREGREIGIGELVAVYDPAEYEEIKLALADADPALREELQRRLQAQEIRSLLAGEIVHISLVQDGDELAVVLYVELKRTPESR